jgi:aerobic carbon-monoxide dehydrogenase small subunit
MSTMKSKLDIILKVNGQPEEVSVRPTKTLLDVLREELLLTGAKRACNQGVCGACTVLMDGNPVRACLCLAANSTDCEITTVEGLATANGPSPVQQAFLDAGAIQCGFCMPGFIVAATALLAGNPKPSKAEIREGLSGNLCRCSGYVKVIDAVRLASTRMSGAADQD